MIRDNIKEYRRIRNEESYRLRVEKERQRLERRSKFQRRREELRPELVPYVRNQNDPHRYVGPSPVVRDMQRRHAKRIQYAPEARLIAFG